MGRPRKLRPEDGTVTAPPEQGEVSSTNGKEMLPYYGSASLKYGEKRYFVAQGKKLIVRYYAERMKDKDGNPLYKLASQCVASITRNERGQRLAAKLKALKIPGADNIALR